MRIAIFSETYLPDVNGVATHIKTLKDGLEALGHEVLIVKADASSRRNYIEKNVMHCPAIRAKKLYNYSIASPISLSRLLMLKKWNPDIIHIQNEFGIGLSGVFIAKMLKKPLVYTLHTMYDDYIYYIAHKPFIPLVKNISHKYARSLAKNASAVTGASKKIEDYFKKCGVQKPIHIIPNAVELDIFNEENIDRKKVEEIKKEYGLTEDITAACFCGRLGKEKSVDVLLNYWAQKVSKDDRLRLFIFGDGPDKEALMQQAKDLGISDMVFFTGKIPHDSLPPYYAACQIYVTASLSENYSIAMLEAMASGLPIVHLYDEANESQTIEGVNGFAFHNADEMYEIIKKLRDLSPEDKKAFADNVRFSVKKSGAEDLAKYVLDIYNSLQSAKCKSASGK